jgi:DNA-binding NarL/FixJ family response regulator
LTESTPKEALARRVFLVDDHAILREGVMALLALESDFEVVDTPAP